MDYRLYVAPVISYEPYMSLMWWYPHLRMSLGFRIQVPDFRAEGSVLRNRISELLGSIASLVTKPAGTFVISAWVDMCRSSGALKRSSRILKTGRDLANPKCAT